MAIDFRPATMQDALLLWNWRNDELTRMSSLRTEIVPEKDHMLWLENSLRSPDRQIFLAENQKIPIGVIRFDRGIDAWELSWTVAPPARGKGFGKEMVRAATNLKPEPLRAQVRAENRASISIALNAGFEILYERDGVIHLQLKRKTA